MKYLRVAQINSRLSPIPLHWLQNNSLFPIIHASGLTSFRQLLKFPATHVFRLQEHQFHHSNPRKVPCTPYHLKKGADSQDSSEQ